VKEKKGAEGEEEEEDKKEDEEEGKSTFNPNLYAWSKQTGQAKHLVQVFNKFKQPQITQVDLNHTSLPSVIDELLTAYLANPSYRLVFIN
jgi:hypothetical protein